MDPEYLRLIASYDEAMKNRDKSAVHRISCKIFRAIRPGEVMDIARMRAIDRIYAKQLHGWEMP